MHDDHEPDERLMQRAAGGSRDPMNRLVERYARPLLTLLVRMTGDRHRSEELFSRGVSGRLDVASHVQVSSLVSPLVVRHCDEQVPGGSSPAIAFAENGCRLSEPRFRGLLAGRNGRARRVGHGALEIVAHGGELSDAVRREIGVVPDGRRVEQVFKGTLAKPARLELNVPDGAIEGSAKTIVKLYPSSFSQLLEGLDAIFQRPYGCFEQTSSTTYSNVLALDYLRHTGKSVPAVEAKAREYIHLGYQRLLGFEVGGGGFDWFGNPPANRTLTAYGLTEFGDMARVHDVDPAVIERTRRHSPAEHDGLQACARERKPA